jgi:hypothetical protein
MDNSLGIAVGAIGMSAGDKLFAKREVVVDFSVEHNPNGAVFIAERLVPGGEIHNAQTTHANAEAAIGVEAFVVWAAMRHDIAHPAQFRGIDSRFFSQLQDSSYATHCKDSIQPPDFADICLQNTIKTLAIL